ncbi:FAD binding domain-containing protein [Arthrobacter bambusae]|uniref:Carbon-monoxide dehydrogenase medium subunit n=1 Tax=Arthrobacter bambusae TaxID=1338426 RepID=A0AAW8DL45_9MICC|nr:xanthine dehydrogenase family protein subunit M [Arthrobacter bambusae]MDP9906811.1 carbon-monoxide dehydrogenase medium subunit [Arthrobacter bambusae]MDQ0130892.1 carbon-monoxide dehydrogenase medium subunit [Arthrobacter bambusae]MDQ0182414.1 carbon-monoxide dehydrogenase medium subunit [Arthrobacter bambusae]
MIPSAFDYAAPATVAEALSVLADAGDDVKLLAGGQSLIPVMKLRLADPAMVVDLGRIGELSGVRDDGDALLIGAMTTHHQIATDPLIAEHVPLLAKAAATVADPQVRHRGTFGGALVHADPAGDMPAPVLAADAAFILAGPEGERRVAAADFFQGYFTTAVDDGEILTHIRVPKYTGWGAHYEKFTRVAQQWSIVAVAVMVRVEGGTIAEARIGLTNMASTPLRATAVEQALVGAALTREAIASASAHAAEGTDPASDLNGDAAYRRHLAEVLTKRAVIAAAGL